MKQVGLLHATDQEVWDHARRHGFVIVTRDRDFEPLCALRGAPPKVVWLRVGNGPTRRMEELLRRHAQAIAAFEQEPAMSLLILTDTEDGS